MSWLRRLFGGPPKPAKAPAMEKKTLDGATRDLILSLVAAGTSLDEVAMLYPDIDPEVLARTVRKALKKAPLFLDDTDHLA